MGRAYGVGAGAGAGAGADGVSGGGRFGSRSGEGTGGPFGGARERRPRGSGVVPGVAVRSVERCTGGAADGPADG
ncbi:hypothetical protein CJD44_37405 [Streptomyces sp. alain-838]|nr:hypothetical protein CJD44_37405 [Streptomyces sp. alain-838]